MHPLRSRTVSALSLVEDLVYVSLGILLSIEAFTLLYTSFKLVVHAVHAGELSTQVVTLLDEILLALLVIELLYTVQVSFREHGLVAEPFLIVALIAVILRRILVLTAKVPEMTDNTHTMFRHAIIELSLLTGMIVVLVASLIALQRHAKAGLKHT